MNAVVVGHASLDRALVVNRCPGPGMTAVVRASPMGARRRAGGVAQTCFALAHRGLAVFPVTGVGSDPLGDYYRNALGEAGCRLDGVVTVGERSPTSNLLYADDGTTACLFDPGISTEWTLTDIQEELITAAELVVLMIGPAAVTKEALGLVRPEAMVGWVLKDDPASLAGDLPRRLSERADVVVLNHQEHHLLTGVRLKSSALIAETRGPDPIRYGRGEPTEELDVPEIDMPTDPTGSGDSFAGGLIAALAGGADDREAVQAGLDRAVEMLETRRRREE